MRLSVPVSQFSPLPPPCPLMSLCLLSTSVSLFLLCKQVHLFHFSRFHIYVLICNACFSLSDLLPDPGLLTELSPLDSRFSVWQDWERGLIVDWFKDSILAGIYPTALKWSLANWSRHSKRGMKLSIWPQRFLEWNKENETVWNWTKWNGLELKGELLNFYPENG